MLLLICGQLLSICWNTHEIFLSQKKTLICIRAIRWFVSPVIKLSKLEKPLRRKCLFIQYNSTIKKVPLYPVYFNNFQKQANLNLGWLVIQGKTRKRNFLETLFPLSGWPWILAKDDPNPWPWGSIVPPSPPKWLDLEKRYYVYAVWGRLGLFAC